MADPPHYRHDSLFALPVEVTTDVNVVGDSLDVAVVAADANPASGDWCAATNDATVIQGADEDGRPTYRVTTRLMVGPGSNSKTGGGDTLLAEGTNMDVLVRIHHSPQLVVLDAGRIYAD